MTKCVGDNFKMLVTLLAILVTNIRYLLTLGSGTNFQKMSPRSLFCRQHSKIVTNFKSPTLQCHQHDCSRIGWINSLEFFEFFHNSRAEKSVKVKSNFWLGITSSKMTIFKNFFYHLNQHKNLWDFIQNHAKMFMHSWVVKILF